MVNQLIDCRSSEILCASPDFSCDGFALSLRFGVSLPHLWSILAYNPKY